jgi:uncharacterized protein (TIGR00251 family)
MSGTPFRPDTDGIVLFVKLTPKAPADAIEGIETRADGRCWLKLRVRAVPEKGKANAALEKFLARIFGVPESGVALTAGATARFKTLRIAGDPTTLAARLRERMALI